MYVPAKLAAVAKVTAKESSRYAIHGVALSRQAGGTCRVEATDGRIAVRADWSDEEARSAAADANALPDGDAPPPVDPTPCPPRIIPPRDWAAACKLPPKRAPRPHYQALHVDETALADADARTVRLSATDGCTTQAVTSVLADGSFPNLDNVLPDPGEAQAVIRFDARLLTTALQAVSQASGATAVDIHVFSSKKAALLAAVPVNTDPTNVGVKAAIMPMFRD